MGKNKICWVTPDCFIDCDLYSGIVEETLKYYDIHWIVLFGKKNRFKEKDFDELRATHLNLTVEFVYQKGRMRDVRNAWENLKLAYRIKSRNPDLIYINNGIYTPWDLFLYWSLPKKHYIQTAHQGEVHIGMRNQKLTNLLRWLAYSRVKYINMFSKSQAHLFHNRFPKAKIFMIPLALKDFGIPTTQKANDGVVRFLSFGTINYAKNIDLLIDAACLLYEKGYRNFKVSINGMCKDWSYYENRIKYPDIFEVDIRSIDNSEIANLFAKSDYLVQPYRVVSQSGPTKIAFCYNVPIIASDLSGFADEVKEGICGYLFKSEDVEDLASVMARAIDNYITEYPALKTRMSNYIKENYSPQSITGKYLRMFNEVVSS